MNRRKCCNNCKKKKGCGLPVIYVILGLSLLLAMMFSFRAMIAIYAVILIIFGLILILS